MDPGPGSEDREMSESLPEPEPNEISCAKTETTTLDLRIPFGWGERSSYQSEESYKTFRSVVSEKIRDRLTCPVCLEYPKFKPVFSCSNGHLMCAVCRPKLRRCPICKSKSIDGRNILAEELGVDLLEEIALVNCPNAANGCTFQDLEANMHEHLTDCQCEVIQCLAHFCQNCTDYCDWVGPLYDFMEHLAEEECAQIEEGYTYVLDIESLSDDNQPILENPTLKICWQPVIFVAESLIDFFVFAAVERDDKGRWCFPVRSMAHDSKASKLEAEVKISSRKENGISYRFRGPVLSSHIFKQDAIDSGTCFVLTNNQVKALQDDDGGTLFRFKVTIYKLDQYDD